MIHATTLATENRDVADVERTLRAIEAAEIEARERRAYSIEPEEVMMWLFGIPSCILFLGTCVWAIASNG